MSHCIPRHSEITVSARDMACLRGGRLVFAGLSCDARPGQALVLRGRNGIGKSSLLRLIAGLVPLLEGQLTWHGKDDDIDPAHLCHYLGHLDAIKPSLSVAENLGFWRRYLTIESTADASRGMRTEDALDRLGIGALSDLPAGYLSAGQRRRLALARLVVAARPVWLLDEPTSALDADGQARLFDIVAAHMRAGGLVIAATHTDLPFETRTLDLTPFAANETTLADLAS